MPDLNGLSVFVKVVQEGGFTAAGKVLGMPKGSVSRNVKALESRLGTLLLRRTTRSLSLTEAGELFFRRGLEIMTQLENAETEIGELGHSAKGALRLTASYSIFINLVAPLANEFLALYPDVRLEFVPDHRTLDLAAEDIDIALRMGPLPDSSYTARHLATLPNHIYASPGYLQKYGAPAHPEELNQHRTLALSRSRQGHGFAWALTRDQSTRNFAIQPLMVAADPELLKPAFLAGTGLMLATDMIMKNLQDAGLAVQVLPDWVGRCPELHAVFPGQRMQPGKVRSFMDFLGGRMADHI